MAERTYRDPIDLESEVPPDDYISVIAEWLARDGVRRPKVLRGVKVA